jgi:hypothetical protein
MIVPLLPLKSFKDKAVLETVSNSLKFGAFVPSSNIVEGVNDILENILFSNLNKKAIVNDSF